MTRTRGSSDCKSPAWRAICSDAMARASARAKPIMVEARNRPRFMGMDSPPGVAQPNAAPPAKPATGCRLRTWRKENSRSARFSRRWAHRPETEQSRDWRAVAFPREPMTTGRYCPLRRQLAALPRSELGRRPLAPGFSCRQDSQRSEHHAEVRPRSIACAASSWQQARLPTLLPWLAAFPRYCARAPDRRPANRQPALRRWPLRPPRPKSGGRSSLRALRCSPDRARTAACLWHRGRAPVECQIRWPRSRLRHSPQDTQRWRRRQLFAWM